METYNREASSVYSAKGFISICVGVLLVMGIACASSTKTATNSETNPLPKEKSSEELTHDMQVAFNLGYDRYKQGDFEGALPFLLKTNEIDKQINGTKLRYPRIYVQIGRSYFEQGDTDNTFEAYTEGLQYDPKNLVYLDWLQWYYANEDKLEEYIAVTENILAIAEDLTPQIPHIVRLKDLYKSRGEYDKALEKVELLMTLDPDNSEYDLERTGLIRNIGGDEALLKEFEAKYQENPNDTEILWQLITAYADQGENDRVIDYVDKYIKMKPDEIDARVKKIDALENTNRYDDAIKELQALTKLRPNEPQYLVDIAEIYHGIKHDIRGAFNWAYRARRIDSGYGRANYKIAELIVEYIENVMKQYGRTAPSYDDKLVYEVAADYFREAAKDPNTRAEGQRFARFYSENLSRTQEDKFMHKGYDKPQTPEYEWIWGYKLK